MRAFCKKCEKVTEFRQVSSVVKAGDNGYCKEECWNCTECGFTPFIKPEPEGKEDGTTDKRQKN